jgi:virginiamycin A acetyltransferase
MKTDKTPDPNVPNPVPNIDSVICVKPTITRKNIIVGDFTYFSEPDFEKRVSHHFIYRKSRHKRRCSRLFAG